MKYTTTTLLFIILSLCLTTQLYSQDSNEGYSYFIEVGLDNNMSPYVNGGFIFGGKFDVGKQSIGLFNSGGVTWQQRSNNVGMMVALDTHVYLTDTLTIFTGLSTQNKLNYRIGVNYKRMGLYISRPTQYSDPNDFTLITLRMFGQLLY